MNLASLILTGIGAVFLYMAWSDWKTAQVVANYPTSTIRSLAVGKAEVKHTIETEEPVESPITEEPCAHYQCKIEPRTPWSHLTDEPIKAPLSGEQCVYYQYKIERREQHGKHSQWVAVDEDTDYQPAWLRDKTGQVPVDLDGVTVKNSHEFEEKSNWFSDYSTTLQQQLDALDVEWEGWFDANLSMRYKERRIEHGDDVYLLGTATDNPAVEDGTAQQGHKDIMTVKDDNEFILALGDQEDLRDTAKTKAHWQIGFGTTATHPLPRSPPHITYNICVKDKASK